MLSLRVIGERHLPANHNNPCSSLATEGTKVSKEIIRKDGNTTAIANEIIEVQEHPHDEAKEARRVYRP